MILNRLKWSCESLTEKSMFFLSWLTARGSGTGSVCLITDTDSPAGRHNTKEDKENTKDIKEGSCERVSMQEKKVLVAMLGWHLGQMCVEKALQLTEQAWQLPNTALPLPFKPRIWCVLALCVSVRLINCARSVLFWVRQGAFWQLVWPWMGREERRKIAETLKYPMEFATN